MEKRNRRCASMNYLTNETENSRIHVHITALNVDSELIVFIDLSISWKWSLILTMI